MIRPSWTRTGPLPVMNSRFLQVSKRRTHQNTLLSEMMAMTAATLTPYATQSLNRGQQVSRPT